MKTTLRKKIGTTVFEFEFEEGKAKDALFTAAGLVAIPETCGLCHSSNVQLISQKAEKEGKTYKYIKVRCSDCRATSTMGENLDGVNVFWKKFEAYTPSNQSRNTEQSQASNHEEDVSVDDIPF